MAGNIALSDILRNFAARVQALIPPPSPISGRRTISAADTIVAADDRRQIVVTAGTFTLAAGTGLPNLYSVEVVNRGNGIVTFTPGSGRTVDGAASIAIYQENVRLWTPDGVNFFTSGRQRGWVLVRSIADVSTIQSGGMVVIADAFADTEANSMEFVGLDWLYSASVVPMMGRIYKGGPVLTANYDSRSVILGATPAGQPETTYFRLASQPTSSPTRVSFRWVLHDFKDTRNGLQGGYHEFSGRAGSGVVASSGVGVQTDVGAVTGVLLMLGSPISSGTLHQRVFRA